MPQLAIIEARAAEEERQRDLERDAVVAEAQERLQELEFDFTWGA